MRLKCLHELFYNSQFKKYNCNSTHSYNRNIWVDIPSYIIFPWFIQVYMAAVPPLPRFRKNILLLFFLLSCKYHTKISSQNWRGRNFHLSTSDLFYLFWLNDILKTRYPCLQNLWTYMIHSLSPRRKNFVPLCSKLSHVLAISQLAWVHTSP